MADHAGLMPSSAHRWGGVTPCPGSVAMEAAVPEEETEESREGTAAHWAAQMQLLTGVPMDLGEVAPNGFVLDRDMLDGAQLYVEYVWRVLGARRPPRNVEKRTEPGAIHGECWGTPDADELIDNTLHVFDYKYGHRFVEVFENEQLTCYTADRLAHLDGLADQLTHVTFHIVQPRCFHRDGTIRTWGARVSDLRAVVNRLRGCASDALREAAPTLATPANCRDCRARTRCDAAQAAGLDSVAVAGTSVPFDLDNAQASRYLTLVKNARRQLEAMETGLEEQLIKAMLRGQYAPGWMLSSSTPREVWKAKPEEVVALGKMLGKNLAAPMQPISVSAARKLGIDETVISEYALRPKGAIKLAPMDFATTRKVFQK